MNSKQFANCKLKEGIPGEPCEDDLMLSTRLESISSIKFFNYLQLGDAVFYYQAYRGITRRSRHTDAYWVCTRRRDKILANRSLFYGCQRCWFSYDLWSCPCSNAKRWETFCQYSTMQHWAFQSITLFPFPNQKRPFFTLSVSDWLSWLRCYHMRGTLDCFFLPAELLIFLCCLG